MTRLMFAFLVSFAAASGFAMTDSELESILDQRLAGDRSGACVAVARVGGEVATAVICANSDQPRPIDASSRFEIGSVSKAIQGVLVARLVARGELDLDEPLAALLPEATEVPTFNGKDILVRHLLTHTSGLPRLPSRLPSANPADPYADLTEELLLASLGDVELDVAPGSRSEYSNMGAMLLSLGLSHRMGLDLQALLERELFAPLGMNDTAIGGPVLTGHAAAGKPVPAWTFATNLAGVGGIRSTLNDMVLWLQAFQGKGPEEVVAAMRQSGEELASIEGQSNAWGWLRLPLNDRVVLAHDGGTGGFSSFMAIDRQNGVASVVMADTSMLDQGSLGDLALHLIDPVVPLGKPRPVAHLPAGADLADYVGEYPLYQGDEQFMGDFVLIVSAEDQQLYVQGTGGGVEQPAFPLEPDGVDRFVHPGLQLEIDFTRDAGGQVDGLDFIQSGHPLKGRRRQ